MTKEQLLEETALRLFVAIAHKDGMSFKSAAKAAWDGATQFVAARPSVGIPDPSQRNPIKPIEP